MLLKFAAEKVQQAFSAVSLYKTPVYGIAAKRQNERKNGKNRYDNI